MLKNKNENNFEKYLEVMTDDVGIFQHSKFGVPDRNFGYTTDDNARALILAVMLYEESKKEKYLKLICLYLSFVHHALDSDGMFKNFMTYQRDFIDEKGSEDCYGRCVWALGRTMASKQVPKNIRTTCQFIINSAKKNLELLVSPRAKAYAIVGLSYMKPSKDILNSIENLSEALVVQFDKYKDKNWKWFENSITYGNAFFPWALLRAYKILGKKSYLETAKTSMDFLEGIVLKPGYFKPIGSNGWLVKGSEAALFDEQPIEACEMLYTSMEYYEISKDKKYLKIAKKCYGWYFGENSKKLDGINEAGINLNQGSESIVAYGMAVLKMRQL